MSFGYIGKVLRVDLSKNEIEIDRPTDAFYRRYLGGGGLASYYLLKELKPKVDPLAPDNILIFADGLLNGTSGPGTDRVTVAAKSPLTCGYGEAQAGGWWAPELKFAGFDAIIIKGKAREPVYLWVHDGEAEIRDAKHIWGMYTGDAQSTLRDELGDKRVRVALIGPGAERLVRYACVVNELRHVAARAGMGAVMGSKNLKAVAVRGTERLQVFDRKAVNSIAKSINDSYERESLWDLGTTRSLIPLNLSSLLPTRNFVTGQFEEAEAISGETMKETVLISRGTCFGCQIQCKRNVRTPAPYSIDPAYGGPEYESVAALGSLCGISDLPAICKANELCNKYTLDTISTGMSIAFAMECYERGILTGEDTGGLDLRFGNTEAMLRLVEMIGERQGLGDLLAEGPDRAAKVIGHGSERWSLTVKRQPLPMHEPRGKLGVALSYALSPTGADHLEAPAGSAFEKEGEALREIAALGILEPVSVYDLGPKQVRLFLYLQNLWNFCNSLGICFYWAPPFGKFNIAKVIDYVHAVTGWNTSLWELMKAGERVNAMARVFNVREGFTGADDMLPERLFEPLQGGLQKGRKIEQEDFEEALKTYYQMVGWDANTGVPTRAKLEELDIGWVADLLG
jgi:aldehyde:ferredoxin oxidoreductase